VDVSIDLEDLAVEAEALEAGATAVAGDAAVSTDSDDEAAAGAANSY
jgi:hypothetical protein